MAQWPPMMERFRAKYRLNEKSGCWEWHAANSGKSGYGVFFADGQRGRMLAHRFAYETFVGPIPEGLELDHKCRNRKCCNPAHLEPVTRRENVIRGTSPNAANALKTHCFRGHELTEENCYASKWPRNRECKTCARMASKAKTERNRLARLQTNDLRSAERNADALHKAIRELSGTA